MYRSKSTDDEVEAKRPSERQAKSRVFLPSCECVCVCGGMGVCVPLDAAALFRCPLVLYCRDLECLMLMPTLIVPLLIISPFQSQ